MLEQAKGDLARAQAQQGKTQLDVKRYTPLANRELSANKNWMMRYRANLARTGSGGGGESGIAAAQAALETAKLNLGFSTIIAPIDGVAGHRECSGRRLYYPADNESTHHRFHGQSDSGEFHSQRAGLPQGHAGIRKGRRDRNAGARTGSTWKLIN